MLGDKIRQHRKRNHLSQEELAEKLGVSRQSVSLWENNQTQPSLENIIVLSKLLGVSTDELLSANNDGAKSEHVNTIHTPVPPIQVRTPPVNAHTYTAPTTNKPERMISEKPPKKKKSKKVLLIVIPVVILLVAVGLFAAWMVSKNGFSSLSAEEIFTKISPSVVEIYAESSTETSTGTGFFIDNKGTVVTNYHVIENCQTAEITLANGNSFRVVSVLGYDSGRDIAVLSTSCKVSTPLPMREGEVKTGEKVYAIGSSLGLTGSLSDGIVSAVNRAVEGNTYIQTTAPISQGNSGGPLVDSKGEVVGIICASFTDGQNLNLAIPIEALDTISLYSRVTLDELFPEAKQEVEWLSDYRFQYYAEEDTYVLLFQLSDKNEIPMSAAGDVKIRIVNDDNVTVYNKTHTFSSSNFEEWIYDETDEMYLATIYISPSSIERGSTGYGTVYFEVYGAEYGFEECTLYVFDLPLSTESSEIPPQGETPQNKFTCLASGCNNFVNNKGEYCSVHGCATIGCPYYKDNNSNYCSVCRCSTTGCPNAKIAEGYYCSLHTCATYGCGLEKEQGSNYCSYHKPSTQQRTCLSAGCDNLRNNLNYYCSEHACAKSGCTSEKSYSSSFCNRHKCDSIGCDNGRNESGYYCSEHACADAGCTRERSYSGNYCSWHECNEVGCENKKKDYGSYCSDHECANSWCTSAKAPLSDYCFVHDDD